MPGAHTVLMTRGARATLAGLFLCVTVLARAGVSSAVPLLTPVQAPTSATIAPSLSPDQFGAKAILTFTVSYAGGEFGVPTPVRRSVLRLPAGLSLDVPSLRSCTTTRLLSRGPAGCPAQAEIGDGHALMEVHAGTENITEDATMWTFLGPPQNLRPTFEILAQGYTPVDERMVLNGTVLSGHAPYGEELVMSIPPIPTLVYEPDASIVTFSLTIGTSKRHRTHDAAAVLVPASCPVGGFPFAASFTYADGVTGSTLAEVPCPR